MVVVVVDERIGWLSGVEGGGCDVVKFGILLFCGGVVEGGVGW